MRTELSNNKAYVRNRIEKDNPWLAGKTFRVLTRREEVIVEGKIIKYYSVRMWDFPPYTVLEPIQNENKI